MPIKFKKKKRKRRAANLRGVSALGEIGEQARPDSDEEKQKEKTEDIDLLQEPEEMDELKSLRAKKKQKLANAFSTARKLKDVIRKAQPGSWQSDRSAMPDQTQANGITVDVSNRQRADAKNKVMGPAKAPANLRVMSRFDYQPDLCKDWKETGYCGYGDSCKFMHDRGDYKSGAQLEREWEEEQKKKRKIALGELVDEEEDWEIKSDDEELPFACVICRGDFVKPVVTKCGHYFCEGCALKRYAKSSRCAACGAQTLGVFNTAHKILKNLEKLAEQKEKMDQDAEDAAEQGQVVRESRSFDSGQGWVIP